MKYFVCFLLLAVYWPTAINGQSCEYQLEGQVIDLHDNLPIFGAVVAIEGTDLFGQTDEEGNYNITGLCKGFIRISVTHALCDTIERNINLRSNTKLNFELEHHINELNEIVLSENEIRRISASVNESKLNADQLTRLSNQSLSETLNTLVGVSSLKTGSSIAKPMIHGLYGSRVAIIANGMRLQDQEWGADHAPTIDLNGFESVQVIKGAAALKYGGDTAGGMIVLTPEKKGIKDSLYGSSVLNGIANGRGGSGSSRLTKTFSNGYYVSGQFTAKQFGDRQAPDYLLTNTGLKETSIGIALGRTKIRTGWEFNYKRFQNETGILRSAHIGNIGDLLRALESNVPLRIDSFDYDITSPKQQALHQNLQVTYFDQLSDETKLKLDYNVQLSNRKEFDVRRGNRSDRAAIDLTLQTHEFLGSLEWQKRFNWDFEWGINGVFQDNYSNPETGVKRLIPDHQRYQLASFITGKYSPSNLFRWEWGLRADQIFLNAQKFYDTTDWKQRGYELDFAEFEQKDFGTQLLVNPKYNFTNISGQTGISVQLKEGITSTFSYILTQRAPNVSELFSDGLHHSLAAIEYGSLNLGKETSHKLILGIKKESKVFSFGFDPFLNSINDFIYINPSGVELTIRGAFPVWEYQATDVLMWGIDAYVSIRFSDQFSYDANAAYTYAQNVTENKPLISTPPLSLFQQLSYTFTPSKIEIQLAHRLTARQNRFPNTNFLVNQLELGEISEREVDVSTPPDNYQILDLYFSLPLSKQKKLKSSLRFIIQNLTNVTYNDYLNRLRFYSSELGRNIQLQLVLNY